VRDTVGHPSNEKITNRHALCRAADALKSRLRLWKRNSSPSTINRASKQQNLARYMTVWIDDADRKRPYRICMPSFAEWSWLHEHRPELFEQAVELGLCEDWIASSEIDFELCSNAFHENPDRKELP
jgi:hypothetical protein